MEEGTALCLWCGHPLPGVWGWLNYWWRALGRIQREPTDPALLDGCRAELARLAGACGSMHHC